MAQSRCLTVLTATLIIESCAQAERARLEWMSKASISAAEASNPEDRCAQLRKLLTDPVRHDEGLTSVCYK